MTELHLDRDEWENILECVRDRRDSEQEHAYREYLDSIVEKIAIALALTPSVADLEIWPASLMSSE